jgi:predicted DNA-binding transcriptional regulator YafY
MNDKHRKDRPAPSGAVAPLAPLSDGTRDAGRRKSRGPLSLRPVSLTEEEAEAIMIGLSNAVRDDPRLVEPARTAVAKLVAASGASTRARLAKAWASTAQPRPVEWDEMLEIVEEAIQGERELRIRYEDQTGEDTIRTIRPLAFAESRKGESVAAWCNLRGDFRHFRLDRIVGMVALDSFFKGEGERLRRRYMMAEG